MSATKTLFSPTQLGAIDLPNRLVMAPLTRSRCADDGIPTEMHPTYYAQRASAGLLITEATNISPQGRGYAYTPGIWGAPQVDAWKAVTHAVHQADGRIVCQLWHVGRVSHSSLQPQGAQPVAPSAIAATGKAFTNTGFLPFETPRALETAEIPGIIEQYRHAAKNALEAGFDGVEVHAANGYLLDQFIRDSTNKRDDNYGGSIENRTRLALEVVAAVVEIWGGDRVGIRLSPVTQQAGDIPTDSDVMATYGYLIEQLNAFNLAYMHFVEGNTGSSREQPDNVDLDTLRQRFDGAFIGNNCYDPELAEQRLGAGKIDAVAFGRPFIANPDLVERLQHNAKLAVAPHEAYYGGDARGFIDWPRGDY